MSEELKDLIAREGINRLDNEMSDFRKEVRDSITSIRHEVSEGFRALTDRLDGDSRSSRPQMLAIGAFAIGIIGITFTFVSLITSPIHKVNDKQDDRLERFMEMEIVRLNNLPEAYEQFGRNSANIENLQTLVNDLKARMHDAESQGSESKADRKAIHAQLDAIDFGGSRKWVNGKTTE